MRAMILAAGRGERMRPLTDTRPKPLLEVGGKSLIGWQIERLAAAGLRDIVINHAWLGEQIERALGDGRALGVSIRYSAEAQALETAGGIANALPLLGGEPFAVISGDVYTEYPYQRLPGIAAQLKLTGLLAWCVLIDNPAHNPRGDFWLDTGRLINDAPATAARLTYANIGVFDPRLFSAVGAGERAPLAPLLRQAAQIGKAGAERYAGRWVDVGTPQRLSELDAQLTGLRRPS